MLQREQAQRKRTNPMNNKERIEQNRIERAHTKENNVERRSKRKTCNTEEGWDMRCI